MTIYYLIALSVGVLCLSSCAKLKSIPEEERIPLEDVAETENLESVMTVPVFPPIIPVGGGGGGGGGGEE
jgi:hypothetical protein